MHLKLVVFFVLFLVNHCLCTSRLRFTKCGRGRFSRVVNNGRLSVEHHCPEDIKEYQLFVNEFNGPAHIDSLVIRNCKKLTVTFRCTTYASEKKNLKRLEISNIQRLRIEHSPKYHSQLPPTVVFENITLIETIPSFSFSQIEKSTIRNKKCIIPKSDFHSISFRNVSIDTVKPNAFYMPHEFGNVTFINSTINNLPGSSIRVNHHKDGVFLMSQSTVEVLHPSALRVAGKSVIFSQNKFAKISSGGINATAESFYFVNNSVNTLQPYALSIISTNTFILSNRFEKLKAMALEKIGPNWMGTTAGGAGTSIPSYNFIENYVNSTEADCFHPDLTAYTRFGSAISILRNRLPCTCGTADWLISAMGDNHNMSIKKNFYKVMINENSENICHSSCNLSISVTKSILKTNRCFENDAIEKLCHPPRTTTPVATKYTTTTPRILWTPKRIMPAENIGITTPEQSVRGIFWTTTRPSRTVNVTYAPTTTKSTSASSSIFDKTNIPQSTKAPLAKLEFTNRNIAITRVIKAVTNLPNTTIAFKFRNITNEAVVRQPVTIVKPKFNGSNETTDLPEITTWPSSSCGDLCYISPLLIMFCIVHHVL